MLGRISQLTLPQVVLVMFLASLPAAAAGIFIMFQALACFMPTLEECPATITDRYPALLWMAAGVLVAGTAVFFGTPLLRGAIALHQRRARG